MLSIMMILDIYLWYCPIKSSKFLHGSGWQSSIVLYDGGLHYNTFLYYQWFS